MAKGVAGVSIGGRGGGLSLLGIAPRTDDRRAWPDVDPTAKDDTSRAIWAPLGVTPGENLRWRL